MQEKKTPELLSPYLHPFHFMNQGIMGEETEFSKNKMDKSMEKDNQWASSREKK